MSVAGLTDGDFPWFQRACLLVRDMEKSLMIYRDLLGFELNYLGDDDAESFSYDIFRIPRHLQTRFATLSSPQQVRTLALIEVPDDAFFAEVPRTAACVVRVSSIERTLAQAAELGLDCCEVRREPAPARGPGRAESAFYDYESRPVVIFELLHPGGASP